MSTDPALTHEIAAPPLRPPHPVALKPYDVRHDHDRGRRRHLAQRTRRMLRVSTLVLLDVLVAYTTLWVVMRGANSAFTMDLLVSVLPVTVLSFLAVHAYGAGRPRIDGYARFIGVLLVGLILMIQYPFVAALERAGTERVIFLWLPLLYISIEIERALVQRGVRALRSRAHLMRPMLVIGTADELDRLTGELARVPESDLLPVGHLSYRADAGGATGTLDMLEDTIHERDVRVVVIGDSVPATALPRLIGRIFAAGASVLTLPSRAHREAAARAGNPPVDPAHMEFRAPELQLPQLGVKRALDFVLTFSALIVMSPVLLLIGLAIKLDSRGPVLFRQVRLGVGGRPFEILKFRTMVADAEQRKPSLEHLNQYADGRLFKIPDDPRITRVGGFLRRTSMDELPQLFNVLKGEMSLVGPRPPLPAEVAVYASDHFVRLTVTPGLTGPWQVNGRNNIHSFDEVVRLEHDYIRNWSLAVDLRILARTIGAVLRRDGAH